MADDSKKKEGSRAFYITTTLPYVNAPLHLGHATEIIRADASARYRELCGEEVFFNTGTDEHGMKIYESAEKAGKEVRQFVDEYAALYKKTLEQFGVSPKAHYVRTTDSGHIEAAQEFWRRCNQGGYIYKKNYQAKYCIGCEEEKTDSELVDGKCPEHDRVPELIDEENYFFKLSVFGDTLLAFYDAHPDFVIPAYRLNELREFIKRGLKDFSISRMKTKLPWGVPVPGDETQVMYVWFDALVNYISTLGWPSEEGDFRKFWVNGSPTQYCGKNNTRFQGLMWQAMLLAAGVPPTRQIIVDGFILGEGGVKMSKSLGNTLDPLDIVSEYGTDALRYFVLREFHPFEDTAVSKEKLKEWYNANLANGVGNLTSRVLTMYVDYGVGDRGLAQAREVREGIADKMQTFDFKAVMDFVWSEMQHLDQTIQGEEPFKVYKTSPEEAKDIVWKLVAKLYEVSILLEPFLPSTAKEMQSLITRGVKPSTPLFPRKE